MKIRNLCIAVFAAPLLIACGSGTGGDERTAQELSDDAFDMAADTRELLNRSNAMPISTAANVPATGLATYSGTLAGVAFIPATAGDPATFLGNVSLNTDFTNNTMQGTARNFVGTTGGLNSDLTRYSGTIAVTNGDFGGADRAAVTANASGTLTSNGNTFVVGGVMSGGFVGSNVEALRLVTPITNVVEINGFQVLGGLELIAER